MLLKRADAAGEGREGVRASFTVHCFEELSCDRDWQRRLPPARGRALRRGEVEARRPPGR